MDELATDIMHGTYNGLGDEAIAKGIAAETITAGGSSAEGVSAAELGELEFEEDAELLFDLGRGI